MYLLPELQVGSVREQPPGIAEDDELLEGNLMPQPPQPQIARRAPPPPRVR